MNPSGKLQVPGSKLKRISKVQDPTRHERRGLALGPWSFREEARDPVRRVRPDLRRLKNRRYFFNCGGVGEKIL